MKKCAAVLFLLLLLANPSDLSSCGPFLPSAVFTRAYGPDDERTFFGGHLGILQPTYERRYLAMAYRILHGEPLNNAQIDAVVDLLRYRSANIDKQVRQWLAARNAVPDIPPQTELDPYRPAGNFISYPGCGADAFSAALQTFRSRIGQAGNTSAEVREWLHAQDQVFDSCKGSANIPDPAPAGSSERVLADRTYQIAAASFYSGDFDTARAKWREIAADMHSPWRVWAPYLVARSFLRQGNYTAAEEQLRAILSDPAEASIHRQAGELLDYPHGQLDPAGQLLALSQRLTKQNSTSLLHDLNDYTFLYDQFENGRESDFSPSHTQAQMQASIQQRIEQLHSVASQNDLTAWILQFQNVWGGKSRDAVHRWRKTKSLAWLLAAANQVEPNTQHERDIIDALVQVPGSSPGYPSARFTAARLLIHDKQNDAAARLLDEALNTQMLDASTRNAFHGERLKVAHTFEEFLRDAPRTVVFVQDEDDRPNAGQFEDHTPIRPPNPKAEPAQSFDVDAADTFNYHLPMSLWRKAVQDRSLEATLRSRIAQAGWVRSIVLGRTSTPFAEQLILLKPGYASNLQSLSNLPREQQNFAGIFWILHHPELSPDLLPGLPRLTRDGRIDDIRQNWWCNEVAKLSPPTPEPQPGFLNAQETLETTSEQTKLKAANSAPSFLSASIVSWVNTHPDDPRNPEALALAVKTSRFTCGEFDHSTSIGRAFRLLHERYPNSTWAKSTPYWY